jgi:hypothetical protein
MTRPPRRAYNRDGREIRAGLCTQQAGIKKRTWALNRRNPGHVRPHEGLDNLSAGERLHF